MTRASFLAVALALVLPPLTAAHGKEREGVQMPDTATVEGKTLKLNGLGVRTRVIFKVYVAGLYVETPSKDASAIIAADQVRRVQMVMLRDLAKHQVAEAISEGFSKNSSAQMGALKERLNQLVALIPDVKKGEQLLITYLPGKGTVLFGTGGEKAAIPGKDFADALFSVWLGKNPVEDDLKKALLGE